MVWIISFFLVLSACATIEPVAFKGPSGNARRFPGLVKQEGDVVNIAVNDLLPVPVRSSKSGFFQHGLSVNHGVMP